MKENREPLQILFKLKSTIDKGTVIPVSDVTNLIDDAILSVSNNIEHSKRHAENMIGLGYELGKQGGSLSDLQKLKENL